MKHVLLRNCWRLSDPYNATVDPDAIWRVGITRLQVPRSVFTEAMLLRREDEGGPSSSGARLNQ